MEYRILGPFEVEVDGRPIALGGAQQRALLALLLIHANEPMPVDRLISELFGEPPPARAVKRLHVAVARLRKALGTDVRRATVPPPATSSR